MILTRQNLVAAPIHASLNCQQCVHVTKYCDVGVSNTSARIGSRALRCTHLQLHMAAERFATAPGCISDHFAIEFAARVLGPSDRFAGTTQGATDARRALLEKIGTHMFRPDGGPHAEQTQGTTGILARMDANVSQCLADGIAPGATGSL